MLYPLSYWSFKRLRSLYQTGRAPQARRYPGAVRAGTEGVYRYLTSAEMRATIPQTL